MTDERDMKFEDVAIVGMGCRFPGASTVDEYWDNLLAGRESISFFAESELDPNVPADEREDPKYVRARGIVADCDKFDAAFFGISPAEATAMDPQQRLFLEVCWEALEHAGCNKDHVDLLGVFAGTGVNTYFYRNVLRRPDLVESYGEFNVVTANDKDYVTTRTSYKLDLRGPSVDVQTACSTSLVAVSQAYWSLMTYQCDVALAGGSSIDVPVKAGYLYQEGSMLSADGHTRPFDAEASGTLFNNGTGVVVLKRVEDAISDGDRIYAVIRGAAVNNDGQDKVSFSAPSVNGQAAVVRQALDQAGFPAESISYVETHGTATPLGDPIEIEALSKAFRVDAAGKQFCGIGSVKSNFGHLVAAAGVAGLIKTALALHHRTIPPSINYRSPNPSIDFQNSPFHVVDALRDWEQGAGPRRAGVSSFGVGGTNAHVVLEEWDEPRVSQRPVSPWQLLPLSARTDAALDEQSARLAASLDGLDDAEFADAAYTLQAGRAGLGERRFIVASGASSAIESLGSRKPEYGGAGNIVGTRPSVAFLFPGQGSQHPNMAVGLYESEPVFRDAMDACASTLQDAKGMDLLDLLYGPDAEQNAATLRTTENAQPAIFAVEYALAQLWMHRGVRPDALVGHSIGEFVAACLAGIFTLDDAIRVVCERGALMQSMAPGVMISVRARAEDVDALATDAVSLAAVNGPELCVLAGPERAIEDVQQGLDKREIAHSRLHTSHAFHSGMMEPAVRPFVEFLQGVPKSAPNIPVVSAATAGWLTAEEATSSEYWGQQIRKAVQFGPAIGTLVQDNNWVLIEVGPRRNASQLARMQLGIDSPHRVISTLGDEPGSEADVANALVALGKAWVAGIEPAWKALHGDSVRAKRVLPTYPFERKRFWADVTPDAPRPGAATPTHATDQTEARAVPSEPLEVVQNVETVREDAMPQQARLPNIIERVRGVFADTSGMEPGQIDATVEFVEQGFDSLFLTQAATALKKEFGVKVTFRELMEDYSHVDALAQHLDETLPPDPAAPAEEPPAVAPTVTQITESVPEPVIRRTGVAMSTDPEQMSSAERVMQRQLDIIQEQLAVLGGNRSALASVPAASAEAPVAAPELPAAAVTAAPPPPAAADAAPEQASSLKNAPRAGAKISKQQDSMTPAQTANLQDFIRRYNARTRSSKAFAQAHRHHLADPRTASGFRPAFKEMVYQIVVEKSQGSRVWDIDGNEYIDLLNGFGSNMLGHIPDYVRAALHRQTDLGLEIGPQTALAGEVAELFCEMSGNERMAFSNTGSEAVAGAVRVARTVTGRNLIVTFDGDYHGIFDEVLVRGSPSLKTLPSSPGVNRESVENMLVLPFNDDSALQAIRDRADDVAGILVECVQGGDPGTQPDAWLRKLRDLATEIDAPLICDEVITGFRIHQQGAQGYFGIKADLATYGKVVGGGLPIGIIAGTSEYMDALDGGQWQFGNESIPEVGVTYFAGTFVRHPLTMAASRAALLYMKEQGPALQERLNQLADDFAAEMNDYFDKIGAPWKFENFGSLMNLTTSWESPFQELLYYLLRENGVHIWAGRPCFLTDAHSKADLAEVREAFERSITALAEMGFLEGLKIEQAVTVNQAQQKPTALATEPPVAGARLGRDKDGNPGWFIADPDRPGKYLQVGVN